MHTLKVMRTLDIITAVLPSRAKYLQETERSVQEALSSLPEGWQGRWSLAVDGPGQIPHVDQPYFLFTQQVGVAVARNTALRQEKGDWILALDGDDLIDPKGLSDLLCDPLLEKFRWLSSNRLLTNGAETAHWSKEPRLWPAGSLAEEWTSPFPFHPSSLLVRRDLLIEAGGWPKMETNQDLALALALSEIADGASTTHPVVRYRSWEGQSTASKEYPAQKKAAFRKIEVATNLIRAGLGRGEIVAPLPQPAVGRVGQSSKKKYFRKS